jgi:hypothetical protein
MTTEDGCTEMRTRATGLSTRMPVTGMGTRGAMPTMLGPYMLEFRGMDHGVAEPAPQGRVFKDHRGGVVSDRALHLTHGDGHKGASMPSPCTLVLVGPQ